MEKGRITFQSADPQLDQGFQWAKKQALAYAHEQNTGVSKWYEAALPGRNAFCMRDVCHQSIGAAALGLSEHTREMLYLFAAHISEKRDYCSYWEITGDGQPCPDDYESDEDFWLNHPGSFEVIRACTQQLLWNQDSTYLREAAFLDYYRLTCHEYVEAWDLDRDGIMEHYPEQGRRGISSYNEMDISVKTAGDMIASQYAGYRSYLELLLLDHENRLDPVWKEKEMTELNRRMNQLRSKYLTQWYDPQLHHFYSALRKDGTYCTENGTVAAFLPIDLGILDGDPKLHEAVQEMIRHEPVNVEERSYYPQTLYHAGMEEKAYQYLLSLADPELPRREYPEVSYAYIGALVTGMMGIRVQKEHVLTTCSAMTENLCPCNWAQLGQLPVLGTEICVRHEGQHLTKLENTGEEKLLWECCFYGDYEYVLCDGIRCRCSRRRDAAGRKLSYITKQLEPGESCSVSTELQ